MKLIVLGATGLVGSELLNMALKDTRVEQIIAPVRRPIAPHPKLSAPVIDFNNLPHDRNFWQADAIICALGTTMKKARSREVFRFADYTLPLMIAQQAHACHTPVWVLNSSTGASEHSRVNYLRIKGELERDIDAIGFSSFTVVRPSVIIGDRPELRIGEHALIFVLRRLSPFISRRWHPVTAKRIAKTMLDAALNPIEGRIVVQSEQI